MSLEVVFEYFNKKKNINERYPDLDEYINDNYVVEKTEEEYPASYYSDDKLGSSRRDSFAGSAFSNASLLLDSIKPKKLGGKKSKASVADVEINECICAEPIAAGRSLDDVINDIDKTFMELVFSFADAKGISDVELQKRANIGRKAFSKLKCGTTKNPSKATALALAIGLELNLDETKDLLSRAGLALSPCSKQDIIVQYFIEKEAYDIYEINVALFEHGEALLGSQAS